MAAMAGGRVGPVILTIMAISNVNLNSMLKLREAAVNDFCMLRVDKGFLV
jgi:hypothetical protein